MSTWQPVLAQAADCDCTTYLDFWMSSLQLILMPKVDVLQQVAIFVRMPWLCNFCP